MKTKKIGPSCLSNKNNYQAMSDAFKQSKILTPLDLKKLTNLLLLIFSFILILFLGPRNFFVLNSRWTHVTTFNVMCKKLTSFKGKK